MAARWTKEAILAAVNEFIAENGRPPTTIDWVKGGGLEHPCAATVEAVFGSWSGAIKAATAIPPPDPDETDTQRQRKAESNRPMTVDLLSTRMGAVFDASAATAHGEEGGQESLRQSLIDLAACAEAMADSLPPPTQWLEDGDETTRRAAGLPAALARNATANGLSA